MPPTSPSKILLVALLAVAVNAVHIVKQRLTYRRIDSAWGNGDVAVFEAQFNETIRFRGTGITGDVTMKDLNGTDTFPNLVDPEAPPTYVPHFLKPSGVVLLNCTRPDSAVPVIFDSGSLIVNGLPVGLALLHPTETPAPSFFRAIGGLHINATTELDVREDTLSTLLFLNGGIYRDDGDGLGKKLIPFSNKNATRDLFDTWSCRYVIGYDDSVLNPNSIAMVASAGVPVAHTSAGPFKSEPNRCTIEQMKHMETALAAVHRVVDSTLLTRHNIRAAQIVAGASSLYEAWSGCSELAQNKTVSVNKTIPFNIAVYTPNTPHPERNRNLCQYYPGTRDYEADPCCNMELAHTMCCNPNTTEFTAIRQAIGSYSAISTDTSAHVPVLKMVLSDISLERRLTEQARQMPVYHADDEWGPMTGAFEDCWASVHSQTCYRHADCRYSGYCDSGRCRVHWDTIEDSLSPCLLERMHVQTRNTLLASWKINQTSDTLVADVAAAIKVHGSQLDCVGPSAQAFRRNATYTYDYFGNIQIGVSDGNIAGCVAKRVCNWNSAITNDLLCNATSTVAPIGNHTCGVNLGLGKFADVRKRGFCHIGSDVVIISATQDKQDCLDIGGTLYDMADSRSRCVFNDIRTPEDCVARSGESGFCDPYLQEIKERRALVRAGSGNTFAPLMYPAFGEAYPFCTAPGGKGSILSGTTFYTWRGALCYSKGVTETECNAIRQRAIDTSAPGIYGGLALRTAWHAPQASCVSFTRDFSTSNIRLVQMNDTLCREYARSDVVNSTATWKFHMPMEWHEPEFDTEESCAEGVCQHPNMQFTSRTTCASATDMCEHTCSGCMSTKTNPPSYDTLQTDGGIGWCILPSGMCVGQVFTATVGTNRTFGGISYCTLRVDEWKCTNLTGTFYTCHDLTANKTQCSIATTANPATLAEYLYKDLSCKWSDSVPCKNAEHCEASSGRCNDLSATDCSCTATTGCVCGAGACIKPFLLGATGQQKHCLLGNSAIVQVPIGCRNVTATREEICDTAAGYRWFPRALTAQTCADHGTGCPSTSLAEGSTGLLGRTQEECQKCGASGVVNLHTFTPPKLLPGAILDTVWARRQMVTENQWRIGVSYAALKREISKAAASNLARNIISTTGSRHTSMMPLLKAVAINTDPLAIANSTLYNELQKGIGLPKEPYGNDIIPTCTCIVPMHTQESQTCACRHGSITIPSRQNSVALEVSAAVVHAGLSVGLLGPGGTRQQNYPTVALFSGGVFAATAAADEPDKIDSANYDIVKDEDGDVVGRIVGPGFYVSFSGNATTTATVCMGNSHEIDRDYSTYPIRDFGTAKTGGDITPASVGDVTETGTEFCGTIAPKTLCVYTHATDSTSCTLYPIIKNNGSSKSWLTMEIIIYITVGVVVVAAAIVIGLSFWNAGRAAPIKFSAPPTAV